MKFGPVPVEEAVGAIAAHSVRAGDASVKKGRMVTAEDAERLARAGVAEIVAVRLGTDDVGEDEAALRLAERIAGAHARVDRPFTGRANLFAAKAGVLVVDRAAIDGINAIDEAITVATLAAPQGRGRGRDDRHRQDHPLCGSGAILKRALAVLDGAARARVRVAPYVRRRIAVASTVLPGLKPSVIEKTLDVLGERIAPAEAAVVHEVRVPHESGRLAEELRRLASSEAELVIVFGASAIADRRDVIPAALEAAGGKVEHFGMPVDPGNLLLIGSLAGKPVIGAPGCARSPKENGFDWVLHRLLADVPVTRADIVGMGVGGLLMEIVSRPQPREERPSDAHPASVAAVILAAGQSTPHGRAEQAPRDDRRRAPGASHRRGGDEEPRFVGGRRDRPPARAVSAALAGPDVEIVRNPDYAEGLSTSLRRASRPCRRTPPERWSASPTCPASRAR